MVEGGRPAAHVIGDGGGVSMPGKRIYYYLAVLAIAGVVILYDALPG
jgi:hypothetical protein